MYVLHFDDSSHYYCFKKITKTYMYVSDFLMAQVTILPDHQVDMICGGAGWRSAGTHFRMLGHVFGMPQCCWGTASTQLFQEGEGERRDRRETETGREAEKERGGYYYERGIR